MYGLGGLGLAVGLTPEVCTIRGAFTILAAFLTPAERSTPEVFVILVVDMTLEELLTRAVLLIHAEPGIPAEWPIPEASRMLAVLTIPAD